MKKFIALLAMLLALQVSFGTAELASKLNQLLSAENEEAQEKILKEILKAKPSPETLLVLLKGIEFEPLETTGIMRQENLCLDGVRRPFYWYIPASYDPTKKAPLLVYLHGGISRPEIIENPEEYVKESPFLKLADEEGYVLLFPLGQAGATWWDSVGVANVLEQVRLTKRKFNIDDNRVYLTGFSDGASGSFFFTMCHPTDFAVFLPLNGHPGVGSTAGEIQTYFINLFNRPCYVVNTDQDQLYPDKEIRLTMELAQRAGANIFYRIYTGIGHSFDYALKEIPLMAKFIATHIRIANPPVIKWETAYPKLGRCMWLAIDSIKADGQAEWHTDHNMELVDDRVMFGFIADDKYEGPGVKIGKIVGDSTLCALAGMKEGDILIRLGKKPVNSMDDIAAYKAKKKCGDVAEMTVLRDGKELEFTGKFPGPRRYSLFKRGEPSARIEASFLGNRFTVRGSQVGGFTIYLHPDMIQLDQNLVITINGKEVFNKKVKADPEFILRNFLKNRDRELLYVNKITIRI